MKLHCQRKKRKKECDCFEWPRRWPDTETGYRSWNTSHTGALLSSAACRLLRPLPVYSVYSDYWLVSHTLSPKWPKHSIVYIVWNCKWIFEKFEVSQLITQKAPASCSTSLSSGTQLHLYLPRRVKASVHNSATFPMLLLKSSKKVVILNEISSK